MQKLAQKILFARTESFLYGGPVTKKFRNHEYYTYDDVLICPKFSELTSRRTVDTSRTLNGIHFDVPVVTANMITVVSEELAVAIHGAGGRATLHQFDTIDHTVKLLQDLQSRGIEVLPTVGTTGDSKERTEALIKAGAKIIIVDTPHAHNSLTKTFLEWYKSQYSIPVWVGNIATAQAAVDLISWGANGLKVGIGPGLSCITRVQTGVGIPQLSAVLEVVEVAKKSDVIVIADGGVSYPGQFAKALAAGADLVMIGNLFAGTDEAPGDTISVNGKQYKEYFGSASSRTREARNSTSTGQGHKTTDYIEGASGLVPYRGGVIDVVTQLKHGLQSAMSYVGAHNLNEFYTLAEFIKISPTSHHEGGSRVTLF